MLKKLASGPDAQETLLSITKPVMRREVIPLAESVGRVVSRDIISPVDLPGFDRAAMDGYALRSFDTRGATTIAPVYLEISDGILGMGDCVKVRTGSPVPSGADAVVMLEDAFQRDDDLEIRAEVHPGKNLAHAGEDVSSGDLVYAEGHKLRPPDVALLVALGLLTVEVYEKPRVAIIPTGSELVPIGCGLLKVGETYETNGLMSELYTTIWGGVPKRCPIVKDDPDLIIEEIAKKLEADLIIISGGTSVGDRDYLPAVLKDMGELLVHGVRITPGRPTAIGAIDETPVICIPGYPVAAIAALYLFARPAIKKLAHLADEPTAIRARLSGKIQSRPGYLTFARVRIEGGEAVPIMTSGAGILSSVGRAQGYVIVPEELEGIDDGEIVEVCLIE